MAYFKPYIDTEGIHVPSYDDTLEYIINQYKAIFGEDVYLGTETPDYQMISVFAKCLTDYSALAIDSYNSRNPNFATGNSLDVLVQMSGLMRRVATPSTCVLKVSGTEGTIIPSGKKAIDKSGYLWTIQEDVTIPAAGYANANAVCDTPGAILAVSGDISGIYTPVIGWSAVTNESAATVGKDTESDALLRQRFLASHSSERNGLTNALISALINLPDVEFVALIVNDTGGTVDSVPAHSIYTIISGGDADEIAKTIYDYKAPGIGTHGAVSKTVTDETGATHTVKFSRPTTTEVTVTVTIVPLAGYTSDSIDPIIKQAIIDDINSLGIGKEWNVTMGYKDIYSMFPGELPVSVSSISATTTAHGTSTTVMECDPNEILTTNTSKVIIAT